MDEVWKRDEIESPCVKICLIDEASGLCIGCGREREEIALWSQMGQEKRREIIAKLPARLAASRPKRRGGRSRKG